MFCSKCGTLNGENAVFCKYCGNKLLDDTSCVQTPVAIPYNKVPHSSHPVLNTVKKIASSPLFLVGVIAYSLQILFSFINIVNGGTLSGIIYSLLDLIEENIPYTSYEIYKIYDILENISYMGSVPFVILGIISLIPAILICIGLWITYRSASDRTKDDMTTSGLTIIKVLSIIDLVLTCISFVLTELVLLIITMGIATTEYAAAVVVMVFVILLVALFYVLLIVYYSKLIQSLNAVKYTIIKRVPYAKASVFVAVWAFISAFGAFLTLFTSVLGNAASITALICFGILIFKFNTGMTALITKQE